jgi:hypothetical protein
MSRVKENKELLDILGKQASLMDDLNIDATDSYNIGNILVILGDISKSLAVIADKLSEESNDG